MTHLCPDCRNAVRECCDSLDWDEHRTVCPENAPKAPMFHVKRRDFTWDASETPRNPETT
jgi:hypothetical protein